MVSAEVRFLLSVTLIEDKSPFMVQAKLLVVCGSKLTEKPGGAGASGGRDGVVATAGGVAVVNTVVGDAVVGDTVVGDVVVGDVVVGDVVVGAAVVGVTMVGVAVVGAAVVGVAVVGDALGVDEHGKLVHTGDSL